MLIFGTAGEKKTKTKATTR